MPERGLVLLECTRWVGDRALCRAAPVPNALPEAQAANREVRNPRPPAFWLLKGAGLPLTFGVSPGEMPFGEMLKVEKTESAELTPGYYTQYKYIYIYTKMYIRVYCT